MLNLTISKYGEMSKSRGVVRVIGAVRKSPATGSALRRNHAQSSRRHDRRLAGVTSGRIGIAHLVEGMRDQARADHLRRDAASEAQRTLAKAARHEAHRQEVPREVDQVLDVVAVADLDDDVVEDRPQVVAVQVVGPTDADVAVEILRERRGDDALLTNASTIKMLRVVPELGLAARDGAPGCAARARRRRRSRRATTSSASGT